jgi:hypothetical protein
LLSTQVGPSAGGADDRIKRPALGMLNFEQSAFTGGFRYYHFWIAGRLSHSGGEAWGIVSR